MRTRTLATRAWRLLERTLLVIGLACVGYVALTYVDMRFEQARENREVDRILQSRTADPQPGAARAVGTSGAAAPHGLLGRLDIPRLGVSATVREGDDARTLKTAIGHIPGTATPGEPGNAGLAAHRDTFFRRLKDIHTRDEITFTAADGVHTYVVNDTRVVDPSNVEVLNDTPDAVLTLITCYPFNYVGSAPQRFVVRAVRRTAAATPAVEKTADPNAVRLKETHEIARPLGSAPHVGAPRPKRMAASARTRSAARDKGNAFARFFKAAARGLGFAPREPRVSTQNESFDPRNQRR